MKSYMLMKESRNFPDRKVDYYQIIEVLCEEKGKITHWRKTRLSARSVKELQELASTVLTAFVKPVVVREIRTDGVEVLIKEGG